MNVLPLGSGLAAGNGAVLRVEHDLVKIALESGGPACDVSAGDIDDVAVDLGAGIDQDELALFKDSFRWGSMKHGGIRSAADDGVVTGFSRAPAKIFRFDFNLDPALGESGSQHGLHGGIP